VTVKAVHRYKLKRDYGISAQKLTKEEIAAANESRMKINISPVNVASAMQDAIQGTKYQLGVNEDKEGNKE
jgi:hypothetical protein